MNGSAHHVAVVPRRTLRDALRHDLVLTGTNKVCDGGDRGACRVLVGATPLHHNGYKVARTPGDDTPAAG